MKNVCNLPSKKTETIRRGRVLIIEDSSPYLQELIAYLKSKELPIEVVPKGFDGTQQSERIILIQVEPQIAFDEQTLLPDDPFADNPFALAADPFVSHYQTDPTAIELQVFDPSGVPVFPFGKLISKAKFEELYIYLQILLTGLLDEAFSADCCWNCIQECPAPTELLGLTLTGNSRRFCDGTTLETIDDAWNHEHLQAVFIDREFWFKDWNRILKLKGAPPWGESRLNKAGGFARVLLISPNRALVTQWLAHTQTQCFSVVGLWEPRLFSSIIHHFKPLLIIGDPDLNLLSDWSIALEEVEDLSAPRFVTIDETEKRHPAKILAKLWLEQYLANAHFDAVLLRRPLNDRQGSIIQKLQAQLALTDDCSKIDQDFATCWALFSEDFKSSQTTSIQVEWDLSWRFPLGQNVYCWSRNEETFSCKGDQVWSIDNVVGCQIRRGEQFLSLQLHHSPLYRHSERIYQISLGTEPPAKTTCQESLDPKFTWIQKPDEGWTLAQP